MHFTFPGSEQPQNVQIKDTKSGMLQLSWSFPNITFTPIEKFVIEVRLKRTNLKLFSSPPGHSFRLHSNMKNSSRLNDSTSKNQWAIYTFPIHSEIDEYQQQYNTILSLAPSTEFEITIFASHRSGLKGKEKNLTIITNDSLGFDEKIQGTIDIENLKISLKIPNVINDTRDSKMFVLIISPYPCASYSNLSARLRNEVRVNPSHHVWLISESEVRYQ